MFVCDEIPMVLVLFSLTQIDKTYCTSNYKCHYLVEDVSEHASDNCIH